jgi:hypothetical protein
MFWECWGQEAFDPFVHLPSEDWVHMYRAPDILPIAPHMVGQTDGHRWGTPRTALAQTFMGPHEVGETDHEPEPFPGADAAPGQTPGAAAPRRPQAAPCAIPPCHTGRLDRRAKLPPAQLLDKAAGTTEDHPAADVDDLPGLSTHLDDLRVEQVWGGHKTWCGLAAHFPPPPATIPPPQHLEQRGGIGFPPIRQAARDRSGARHNLRSQRGGHRLRARADVDPQQQPAAHSQGGMDPRHLAWTQLRMGLSPWPPWDVYRPDHLAMVGLSALRSDVLQAMHRLEIDRTNVGGARLTDAPALTLRESYDRGFGELTAGPQRAFPFGALPVACGAAQPFEVLVRACPRPMRAVAFAGPIEPRTLWMWTRESSLSLLRWRRLCHGGPPVARNGPKDTDMTPVFARYSSPGLPIFDAG